MEPLIAFVFFSFNMRLMTQGSLYACEFEKDGRSVSVRVEGRLTLTKGLG